MNLEKAITLEVAKMLTVGFEYHSEYGTTTKEAALTPHIKNWLHSNKEEIMEEVIKQVGKEKLVEIITEKCVAQLTDTSYGSYRWESLYKETAPLIADKVAQKMYEAHKKEICK